MGILKILILREKWSHMSDVSGFDPLFVAFGNLETVKVKSIFVGDNFSPKTLQFPFLRIFNRLLRFAGNRLKPILQIINPTPKSKANKFKISAASLPAHDIAFERLLNEYQKESFDLIILSSGDSQFVDALYFSPVDIKNRTVLFFHQPTSWLKLNWKDFEILNEFKAIFTLSENSKLFFKEKTNVPIFRINHGVNLSFFNINPQKNNGSKKRILFVGAWLRDFQLLLKVTQLLNSENFDFELNCIIPRGDRYHLDLLKLATFKNVNFYADLTAEELKAAYHSNDLFFLPLIDATANNGMNEALACGLPVVATKIGGTSDYLKGLEEFLAEPNNEFDHVLKIKSAFHWMENNENYKNQIRNHAEKYLNWNTIASDFLAKLTTDL